MSIRREVAFRMTLSTLAISCLAAGSATSGSAVPVNTIPQPGCSQLSGGLLYELGVTPGSLAAVGATDAEVTAVVIAAHAFCEANATELSIAAQRREELAGLVQALEDKVRAGQASVQEKRTLVQSRGYVMDEADAQAGRLETLRLAIASTLSSEQRDWLANIHAARAMDVPMPFKVIARSDADWVALRSAETREEAETGAIEVAAAVALYDSRREDVLAAWQTALGN